MMRVTVLFFARARELAGTSETQLELDDTVNTDNIAERLLHDFPSLQEIMGRWQRSCFCDTETQQPCWLPLCHSIVYRPHAEAKTGAVEMLMLSNVGIV